MAAEASTNEFKSILIEKLTLGVVKSLEKRHGIHDVILDQRGPADTYMVTKWEAASCCNLPNDLKEFYMTSDGFLLTWKVKLKDELIPVGRMEINSISKLNKISVMPGDTGQGQVSTFDIDVSEEDDPNGLYPHFDSRCRIFELDPCLNLGKLCLVYRNTKQGIPAREPEYWFLDKSLRWHFITNDFQSYFRLLLTNIGLPQWQYMFTDIGVTPSVQQWYSLYAPVYSDLTDTSSADLLSTSTEPAVNRIDINRVFKGKEKKKPAAPMTNQAAAQRRKTGSPQFSNRSQSVRGGASASISKSNASAFNR